MRRAQGHWFFVVVALIAAGCATPDAKFKTPEATIETLFTAYGVNHMSEAEARARLANREHFQLRDPATYQQCFSDWMGPQDEGLAGYVFGSLIAAKESLFFQRQDQQTLVQTRQANGQTLTLAVMTQVNGKWKIALKQSVPQPIRERLYEVYQDARRVGG